MLRFGVLEVGWCIEDDPGRMAAHPNGSRGWTLAGAMPCPKPCKLIGQLIEKTRAPGSVQATRGLLRGLYQSLDEECRPATTTCQGESLDRILEAARQPADRDGAMAVCSDPLILLRQPSTLHVTGLHRHSFLQCAQHSL